MQTLDLQSYYIREKKMWNLLILTVSLSSCYGLLSFEGGACSRKCQIDEDAELSNEPDANDIKFPCSCSPSCAFYGDCCADSPYKSKGLSSVPKMQCLPVSGISGTNNVMAVGSCPHTGKSSAEFCEAGLGFLPLVTSLKTGITYTNIYCAVCNDDGHNLKTWDARLDCCEESKESELYRQKKFVSHSGHLWLELERKSPKSNMLCQCEFVLRTEGFLKKLEVRSCSRPEISRCSSTWRNMEVRETCRSYLDPVYVRNKVYRNRHCALCNHEIESELSCVPEIVITMREMGFTDSRMILEYCKTRNIEDCVHFMISNPTGVPIGFHEIIAINTKVCVPPPGSRCCDGYMFDYRHKRCRKLRTNG